MSEIDAAIAEEDARMEAALEVVDSTLFAVSSMPLIERLRLAHMIIFNYEGDRDSVPQNPMMVMAASILRDAIQVIEEKYPGTAQSTDYIPVRPKQIHKEVASTREV